MQENLYNCEHAYDELPLFAKYFIQKYIKKIPIKVPVRRNCMTGSGVRNHCHSNVMELVDAGRGNFLSGLCVRIIETPTGIRWVKFIDHSVWITPEGKAVDVTAHNFCEKDFIILIPLYDKNPVQGIHNFFVDETYKRTGINVRWLDTHHHFVISSALFNLNKLKYSVVDMDLESLKQKGDIGGFTLPSTATGKYWSEIVSERKVTQNAIA